jgi:demethylspheroidene O-methyltransferase
LRAAHAALSPGGRLLVAEPLADTSTAGRLLEAYFDMYLLAMGQGRLRRPAELRAQLTAAGFSDIRRRRTPIPLITSVIESRKVRTT